MNCTGTPKVCTTHVPLFCNHFEWTFPLHEPAQMYRQQLYTIKCVENETWPSKAIDAKNKQRTIFFWEHTHTGDLYTPWMCKWLKVVYVSQINKKDLSEGRKCINQNPIKIRWTRRWSRATTVYWLNVGYPIAKMDLWTISLFTEIYMKDDDCKWISDLDKIWKSFSAGNEQTCESRQKKEKAWRRRMRKKWNNEIQVHLGPG